MGTSTKKQTPSRKKRRASHFALKKKQLNVCSQCKKPILPHCACKFCGKYKDKEVIKIRPIKEERSRNSIKSTKSKVDSL